MSDSDKVMHFGWEVHDRFSDTPDHATACGASSDALSTSIEDAVDSPEEIQRVTCDQCLLKLFMIGDSAAIALKRMGMRVDVQDILPDEVAS